MSNLGEFLSLVSKGKKDYLENDIKGKTIVEVKKNVKSDLSELFSQLSSIQKQVEILPEETEGLQEAQQIIAEVMPEPVKEEVNSDRTFEMSDVTKYLTGKSFQQPNPDKPTDVEDIRKKVKFLEQWLGKISALGPGGGEVRLKYMDDVDRSTIADGRYLRYESTTDNFIFDNPNAEEIGTLDYIQLNTSGPGISTTPGMLSWNADEDCLDVTQNDGSIAQVGLESYVRVSNGTGSTLQNGTCVRFGGINGNVPQAVKMLGDGSVEPLYLIGILTNDIEDGEIGRATVFGNVRGLDTRGTNEGEVWQVGDILWSSPDTAGALTKVKPTMPDISVSVAAVTKVGETDGELLVRPTIWPRLFYGTFSSEAEQTAALTNTAYSITYDTTRIASGFTIESNSRVKATYSGLYNFNTNVQLTSTNSSAKNIYFWVSKNGTDIADTARITTLSSNGQSLVFSGNWTISLDADDYVEIKWATNDITLKLASPASTAFAPATPSVLLTVNQSAL